MILEWIVGSIVGILFCASIILALRERKEWHKFLVQRIGPLQQLRTLFPQPFQADVLPIWGKLKEEWLVQEQGVATKANIARLRQSLSEKSTRNREEV